MQESTNQRERRKKREREQERAGLGKKLVLFISHPDAVLEPALPSLSLCLCLQRLKYTIWPLAKYSHLQRLPLRKNLSRAGQGVWHHIMQIEQRITSQKSRVAACHYVGFTFSFKELLLSELF